MKTINEKPGPRATNVSPTALAQPHPFPSYIPHNQIVANIATVLFLTVVESLHCPHLATLPLRTSVLTSGVILNWQVVNTTFVSWVDGMCHPVIYPIPPPTTTLPLHSMLSKLAIESFNLSDDEAGPLLAVGFNANAWMHSVITVFSWGQAGTGESHEMETIFCCLAGISWMLLHPYFIFDGPDCPQLRRGIDPVSSSAPCLFVQCFQELLTVFSFDWHVAPCEAKAELAYLQSGRAIVMAMP
ncbi:hypothetical protein EDC04DRAFT_2614333 [Pisolithus marmoratus]|nr:hypothetical protein EDC04DRAFT_2614333 [Pisolithus marmoratus]